MIWRLRLGGCILAVNLSLCLVVVVAAAASPITHPSEVGALRAVKKQLIDLKTISKIRAKGILAHSTTLEWKQIIRFRRCGVVRMVSFYM
ncbi:hypothetical protein V6N13_005108 [Hibiscus sabdariffa]|uniref:Uncharacterized protein n=2 Tax=Hibiscus sabdariffa TaxID=183260 RepID=A0ABR2C3S0_9ROSI